MITPGQENQRMAARILGISEDDAAARLDRSVVITAGDGEAAAFATELTAQLERTIHVVGSDAMCDLEITIHAPQARAGVAHLPIALYQDRVAIGTASDVRHAPDLHGVQRVIAACYAAGVVLTRVIEGLAPATPPDPFVVRFDALGATSRVLSTPLHLADTVLAGAGAVGNGFLRAARHLDISGTLTIADPKVVGGGNPNRCLYFDASNVGRPKAERLCTRAAGDFSRLTLVPEVMTFGDIVRRRGTVRRVIVGADSRPARRSIQQDMPLEVLDASTTGATEVIVHSHRQPTQDACLACIYHHIPDELARQRAIAEGLGLALDDVVAGDLIDARVAAMIAARHPSLDATALVGMAFDSLYKQMCAEQALLTATGEQVLAPFAFVSNLAGALLALELARFDSGQRFEDGRNYLFVSPWMPPSARQRLVRPRIAECVFCSDPATALAWPTVWPNWARKQTLSCV